MISNGFRTFQTHRDYLFLENPPAFTPSSPQTIFSYSYKPTSIFPNHPEPRRRLIEFPERGHDHRLKHALSQRVLLLYTDGFQFLLLLATVCECTCLKAPTTSLILYVWDGWIQRGLLYIGRLITVSINRVLFMTLAFEPKQPGLERISHNAMLFCVVHCESYAFGERKPIFARAQRLSTPLNNYFKVPH